LKNTYQESYNSKSIEVIFFAFNLICNYRDFFVQNERKKVELKINTPQVIRKFGYFYSSENEVKKKLFTKN
jgi:hypothetical protein